MVTAVGLPLLIVNGKFQSLNSMTVEDLETFIPFLVKCSVNRAGAQLTNGIPQWWPSTIKFRFPLQKPKGLSQIGYHKHLSSVVCSCYWYHDAQYLLPFCAKIANSPESVFLRNNEDNTTSVFFANNANHVLKFNNENKSYDSKPKKDKSSRRSLLSALPRKSSVIPDIYLCENCDGEFYSHSEMQKHEKECFKIINDNVKKKPKSGSCNNGGEGNGICIQKQDDFSKDIEILKHIKPPSGPLIRKNQFLKALMLQSRNSENVQRLSKLKNGARPHYSQSLNVNSCLHKYHGIEFSSILGRKLLDSNPKRELMSKIERSVLVNDYYCGTSSTTRTSREHREPIDFRVTCKRPKKCVWTHLYSFSRKQRKSRYMTLKTGLNESSRKLLRQCKQCHIILKRLKIVS